MNEKKLTALMLPFLLLTGCGGHIAPIVPVNLPQQEVHSVTPSLEVQRLKQELNQTSINPIYLFIEGRDQDVNSMANQSGTRNKLPDTFRVLAMSVASSFGDAVKVVDNRNILKHYLKHPHLQPFCYEVIGAITAYDVPTSVISSGVRAGFEIKSSDENGKFRNTDEEGEMIVDILFKQGGMVVVPTNGIINIRSTNRGYTFGLRIQDGGFGIDSQHTEKDGIGSSLRKVVSYAMAKGIRQIIESKNPHISKRQSTPHRIFQQQPLRRNRIPSRSYYDSTANITQEEEDFIRSLRNHSNQM